MFRDNGGGGAGVELGGLEVESPTKEANAFAALDAVGATAGVLEEKADELDDDVPNWENDWGG